MADSDNPNILYIIRMLLKETPSDMTRIYIYTGIIKVIVRCVNFPMQQFARDACILTESKSSFESCYIQLEKKLVLQFSSHVTIDERLQKSAC